MTRLNLLDINEIHEEYHHLFTDEYLGLLIPLYRTHR